MINRLKTLSAATIVACGVAGIAWAHSGAMGVVKERMDAMIGMADALEQLTVLSEQDAPDPMSIAEAAAVIERHAGEEMTALFPDGTLDAPSQAVPAIWEDWAEFAAIANELERLAVELGDEAVREGVDQPPPVPVEDAAAPRESIWDSLDDRELLGLKSDLRIADLIASSATSDEPRPRVTDLYRSIVANCSACHARFRRERE